MDDQIVVYDTNGGFKKNKNKKKKKEDLKKRVKLAIKHE